MEYQSNTLHKRQKYDKIECCFLKIYTPLTPDYTFLREGFNVKCLIIAAGQGSRLSEMGSPKPLIPLLGLTLIERVIYTMLSAGIDEFYVVSGYEGERLRAFLDELSRKKNIQINHITNEEWGRANGVSVWKAKEFIKEPFVLSMSDHVLYYIVYLETHVLLEVFGGMGMLQDKDKETVRGIFQKELINPVKIVNFTQELECQYCKETRQLLEEVAGLSDKVMLESYNFAIDAQKVEEFKVEKIPCTIIMSEDKDYGIRFSGIPSGYEFPNTLYSITRGHSCSGRMVLL